MTPLIAKIEALITPEITPEAAQLLRQAVEVEKARQYCPRCRSELVGFDSEKSKEGYYMPCWRCRSEPFPLLPPPPPPPQ